MIRLCEPEDADAIYEIINDSARAYKGQIPEDRYREPYMAWDELLSGRTFLDPLPPDQQAAFDRSEDAIYDVALALIGDL